MGKKPYCYLKIVWTLKENFVRKMKNANNNTENIRYKIPGVRDGEKSCLKWTESVWTESYPVTL